MAKRPTQPPSTPAPRVWESAAEIHRAVAKLRLRISDLEVFKVTPESSSQEEVLVSRVRDTIRDAYGHDSVEYLEHGNIRMWHGPMYAGMSYREEYAAKEQGRLHLIAVLNGLIARLEEKKRDFQDEITDAGLHGELDLHPRIANVAMELWNDGHHWEAVFAASKALTNYVKERSGRHDLDGASLMRTVFSRNAPILSVNEGVNTIDQDEQEGMMHLFEGVMLAIRNPGGHGFPDGDASTAASYLSLLSMLAHKIEQSKKRKAT